MTTSSAPPAPELIYVGDPMCSWCWAFDPVLETLERRYDIPLRIVVGGLRPGPSAQPLDDGMRRFLLHHWREIQTRTGQDFNESQLDRQDWVYDTELPARAVVTMRETAPDQERAFFSRLQRAFYAEAVDVTDPAEYPALVEPFVDDTTGFVTALEDDASKRAAWADFKTARNYGIDGFPALLVRTDDDWAVVTKGYMPYEALEPPLTAWLDDKASVVARGLVCEIGADC